MQITEVKILFPYRIKDEDKLKAFASVIIDNTFLVNHLKVISGTKGLFVAMPSRKLTDHCQDCNFQNHLQAKFCNQCGVKLGEHRVSVDEWGRLKLREDIAHPISPYSRKMIEEVVLRAYTAELKRHLQEEVNNNVNVNKSPHPTMGTKEVGQ